MVCDCGMVLPIAVVDSQKRVCFSTPVSVVVVGIAVRAISMDVECVQNLPRMQLLRWNRPQQL